MINNSPHIFKHHHTFLSRKSIFILLLLLCVSSLMAQSEKRMDSLLKEANLMVFDNPDKAIEMIQNLPFDLKDNEESYFNSLLTLASAYTAKGNNKRAIDYGLNAYVFAQQKNNYNMQIRALSLLGSQYYFLNMRDKVNHFLNKAENIISSHPSTDGLHFIKGNIYFIKGLNYKDNLDCNFAINYFDKAIQEYSKSVKNKTTVLNLSIVQIQKGYCLMDNSKINEARSLIEESLKISKNNNFTENISYGEIALAEIFFIEEKNKEALEILIETEQKVDKFSGLNLKLDLYNGLSKNYLKLKDYKNYHKYSRLYLKAKNSSDSLQLQSVKNLLDEITTTKNIEIQNQDKKTCYAIVLVVIIFLILYGFLLYQIRTTTKGSL